MHSVRTIFTSHVVILHTLALLLFTCISNSLMFRDDSNSNINLAALAKQLSPGATISYNQSAAPRWSDFDAPKPGAIVNVAIENDVVTTVNYCLQNNITFLAQSGAHGWSNSIDLYQNGIIINMRGLNEVTFNTARTEVRIGGGAIIEEVINQAWSNNTSVLTGNCNCVGVMGANLGGGYGNFMGLHSFGVDNFISIRVVLANGTMKDITEKDSELWWAFRGAAPNFGIVTSAVMNAWPTPQAENQAWTGALYFSEDKLEQVVQGINDLDLKPKMNIYLYYVTSGPPSYTPIIKVTPFYYGNESEGKAAFRSILDIGPSNNTMAMVPYNHWNDGATGFCEKGDRKPTYGVGFDHFDPSAWRQVWNMFKNFTTNPGTGDSIVITECYSHYVASSIPLSSSSFAGRNIRFNTAVMPWYADASLDSVATKYGSRARDLIRGTDGMSRNQTYINFAFGDETNEVVYGGSLDRLKTLKEKYDPQNVFYHWFPIQT